MSKHTPGPWLAVQPTAIDYRAMQIQTDESLIAVCCGGGPKRAISAPEERANARLIAAAPDLLEALKAYMHAMEGFAEAVRATTGTAYPWEAQDIEREKALAALSKAEA